MGRLRSLYIISHMTAFVNLRYYHQSAGTEILILEEYNPVT